MIELPVTRHLRRLVASTVRYSSYCALCFSLDDNNSILKHFIYIFAVIVFYNDFPYCLPSSRNRAEALLVSITLQYESFRRYTTQ